MYIIFWVWTYSIQLLHFFSIMNINPAAVDEYDVRLTLSDTVLLVLMRLMTSSCIQDEMEYPLMRTISSPTYEATREGVLRMTPSLSIYQAKSHN